MTFFLSILYYDRSDFRDRWNVLKVLMHVLLEKTRRIDFLN